MDAVAVTPGEPLGENFEEEGSERERGKLERGKRRVHKGTRKLGYGTRVGMTCAIDETRQMTIYR